MFIATESGLEAADISCSAGGWGSLMPSPERGRSDCPPPACRLAALTRPTQQCVGTRDLFWTSTGVPTTMKSLLAAQRIVQSW